jgi:hypothetical protein
MVREPPDWVDWEAVHANPEIVPLLAKTGLADAGGPLGSVSDSSAGWGRGRGGLALRWG